ncbi:MAG: UDP-3-O-acylglucosamine N-acyltransferase [Candidatus Anoxychlamydiales bacterium]|nr:UDP-3-O-acylglucosamine N-acyltransferase [Candidatus Anoxychlamydiales bacterium]
MQKKITLEELSKFTNSKIVGDPNVLLLGINTLEAANKNEISFLANLKYLDKIRTSKALAFCISEDVEIEKNKNYLISKDPSRTFQIIAEYFLSNSNISGFENIHSSCIIHESANIKNNVKVGPNTVIDQNVKIDENTSIGSNVSIHSNVVIGKNCIIHSNVVIRENTIIQDRVTIQPGAVIGSCGFGYTFENNEYKKITQLGNVILEDDVEIGANTTIDRARFSSTIIHKGAKIDNLVQIAHNVEIGNHSAIAAQTGIAGSTKIGSYNIMGGQVGITGHIKLDDQVMLASRTGVSKNLKAGKYRGSPAIGLNDYNRQFVFQKNLKKIISKLEEKIAHLEEKLSKK